MTFLSSSSFTPFFFWFYLCAIYVFYLSLRKRDYTAEPPRPLKRRWIVHRQPRRPLMDGSSNITSLDQQQLKQDKAAIGPPIASASRVIPSNEGPVDGVYVAAVLIRRDYRVPRRWDGGDAIGKPYRYKVIKVLRLHTIIIARGICRRRWPNSGIL